MKPQPARSHLALLALAMVVPLVLFAALVAGRYVAAERVRIENTAQEKARQLDELVQREIARVSETLQTLATCECLQEGDLNVFWRQAHQTAARLQTQIRLDHATGPVTAISSDLLMRVDRFWADERYPLAVIVPIVQDGNLTYNLVGAVGRHALASLVQNFDLPDGWVAAILDREGNILVRGEPRNPADAGAMPVQRQIAPPGIEGLWHASGESGADAVFAFRRSEQAGITALIGVPTRILELPLWRAVGLLALVGSAALLLAVVLAYLIGERIAGAIQTLALAAEGARQGKAVAVVETPIREVNDVARALSLAVAAQVDRLRERNAAFGRLALQEAQLRSVLDTAPLAAIIFDADGIIRSFSAAAVGLFGFSKKDAIGSPISRMIAMPDDDRNSRSITEFLIALGRSRPSRTGVVTALDGHGERFPVDVAVGIAQVSNQRLFTAFIRDLREQQRIQEELHLGRRMEALGQLTGGIAHDFNNLLTVILGNLEMMETRLGSAQKCRPLLEEATDAAQLSANLIARLLAFGRRQMLNPAQFDAGSMVLDLSGILRRTLGESIEVDASGVESGHGVQADLSQLQSALINLAVNARDAMPNGGKLTISVRRVRLDHAAAEAKELGEGDYVAISLADTGTGMPDHVAQRAFEPFFTTKQMGTGTGLGLSMVYGFAKQSGGNVILESRVGHGATVTLYLKRTALPQDDAPTAPETEAVGGVGRILLVEDEIRVRRVTAARLHELGYEVIEAGNGPAALRTLASGAKVDLVFTDFVMPGGMNGDDLVERVAATMPDMRFLFTSGYARPAAAKGHNTQGIGWLRKPYTHVQLARAIAGALNQRVNGKKRRRAPHVL